MFNRILCTRSFSQLRETFDKYKELAGHDIETAIRRETKGQIRAGYLTVGKVNVPTPISSLLSSEDCSHDGWS